MRLIKLLDKQSILPNTAVEYQRRESLNAARTICRNATDAADAAELLALCGLDLDELRETREAMLRDRPQPRRQPARGTARRTRRPDEAVG